MAENNDQYLQTQINNLDRIIAAQQILTSDAIDRAGENKRSLKAAHDRLDDLKAQLALLQTTQLTKDDFEEILATTFNQRLVSGLKGLFLTTIGVTFAAVIAWLAEHLTVK